MKHRLTYLAAFLVLFIALGLSLLQPAVTQAAGGPGGGDPEAISDPPTLEETARADCNAAYPLGGNSAGSDSRRAKVNACTDAYVIVSKSPNKSKGDVCKNKSGDAAAGCDKGYDLAGGRDTPPDPKPTQSTAAYDFCHDAYPNQGGGTGAAAANAVKIDSCIAAFKSGSSGAGTAAEICKGKSGDAAAACRKGANAGIRAKAKGSVKADEPGSDANGEASPNCENQGGPLGWILCGVFDIMSDGAQWIFANLLEPFLITAPVSTNPQDPSFQIWSNLRIYGNVFLIIALLVIVFGESIGGGMIDAYTAKKVLPRLLVAAILINLSIYIVGFLVDFTNILGKGVGILLTEPLTHCQGASGGNCWE
ncbi:MAG TPA: hypothetical protein VM535_02000, partial [Candidatus Saccharimonadales bacterium]|nr:hypothetical protein [Candidatus Saccharimonadales bacterium]